MVCFKNRYLSERGKNATQKIDESDEEKARKELLINYKNFSSQLVDDSIEVAFKFNDEAVYNALTYVSDFFEKNKIKEIIHYHSPFLADV